MESWLIVKDMYGILGNGKEYYITLCPEKACMRKLDWSSGSKPTKEAHDWSSGLKPTKEAGWHTSMTSSRGLLGNVLCLDVFNHPPLGMKYKHIQF